MDSGKWRKAIKLLKKEKWHIMPAHTHSGIPTGEEPKVQSIHLTSKKNI